MYVFRTTLAFGSFFDRSLILLLLLDTIGNDTYSLGTLENMCPAFKKQVR